MIILQSTSLSFNQVESDIKKFILFFLVHSLIFQEKLAKYGIRKLISYFLVHSEGRVTSDPETQGKSIVYKMFF